MSKVNNLILAVAFLFTYGYGYCQQGTLQSDETNDSIKTTEMKTNDLTNSNKAFLEELISKRQPLTDYPERVTEDFVVYLPLFLPFGGEYKGLKAYYALVPQMIAYYDYSRFELRGIYAEGNTVFVIILIGLKNSESHILLCEQFTFAADKIAEIRTYVLNE